MASWSEVVRFSQPLTRDDVKESDSDPDEGSNPTDDGNTDVLMDKSDDPVREELLGDLRGTTEPIPLG